jgi:hypothetical protein
MIMAGWHLAEVKLEEIGAVRVAYKITSCTGDITCVVIAFSLAGEPRFLIVPPPPSPLCGRGDRLDTLVAEKVVEMARLPSRPGFRLLPCRVSRALLASSLEETLERLRSLGLLAG